MRDLSSGPPFACGSLVLEGGFRLAGGGLRGFVPLIAVLILMVSLHVRPEKVGDVVPFNITTHTMHSF
jgi:hypothetical protein